MLYDRGGPRIFTKSKEYLKEENNILKNFLFYYGLLLRLYIPVLIKIVPTLSLLY